MVWWNKNLQRCDPNEQKTNDAVSDSFLWHLCFMETRFFRENWARFWPVDSLLFIFRIRSVFIRGLLNDCVWTLPYDIYGCSTGIITTFPDWWFGTLKIFFHILGIMIPIDFHIFHRGWNHQPVTFVPQFSRWQPSRDRCVESRRLAYQGRPKESTNVKLRVKVNSPKLLEDTYKSTRFSLSV